MPHLEDLDPSLRTMETPGSTVVGCYNTGMKYAFLPFLVGCMYTRSATDTIPSKTAYCEPKHADVYVCREDDGRTYKIVNEHGYWVKK